MKASDLFVQALENEGVQYVFGLPGEENLDFVESLRKSSIKLITTRHEQSAGFMAATYGRLTGKMGVALATLGPGATNLVTAVAYAQLGGMPVMFITGQKPVRNSKQGQFQVIDVIEMMRPITKFTRQIIASDKIPALVREACRTAEEERPGAVHLELPEDVAREESSAGLFTPTRPRRPIAEYKAISQAATMINDAKCPLILIGAGANRKLVSKMLTEFVNKTGIPFFDTQMGKGVVNEDHPLYIGTAALSANDRVHAIVNQADLIINVGHDVIEKPPFIMSRESAKVIHINFYSAQIDNVYSPHLEVIGDIANSIWQIKEAIGNKTNWDFGPIIDKRGLMNERLVVENPSSADRPAIPEEIIQAVRAVMPDDGIVALDNGMYKIWFARSYRVRQPGELLLDNALATMGAGLPSAISARAWLRRLSVTTESGRWP